MFKAVFFDMDGLFLDSEPEWHQGETDLMRSLGYDWQESDQRICLGGPLTRVAEYMSSCVEGRYSPEWFMAKIDEVMLDRLSKPVPTMPGALEFSDLLHKENIPLALVSASPHKLVDAVFAGIERHNFSFSVAQGDIPRTKPFPDPYLHAAQKFDVDITDCLIFEDSNTGIAAAKASGAFVCAIPNFVDIQEEPRLKVRRSFTELTMKDIHHFWALNLHELDRSV